MLLSASALLWLPLALAIMAGFARYHRVSWGLLIITLLSALGSGYLTFVGAGIICVGFAWRIWLRMVNHTGARPLGLLCCCGV